LETPLLYAIHVTSSLEIAKLLVDAGSNLRTKNKEGANAAHVACWNNNTELVKYFIDKLGLECKDESGNTPLVYAATHGHLEVVEYLLSEYVGWQTQKYDFPKQEIDISWFPVCS
jgi:ankyrin repeat protein